MSIIKYIVIFLVLVLILCIGLVKDPRYDDYLIKITGKYYALKFKPDRWIIIYRDNDDVRICTVQGYSYANKHIYGKDSNKYFIISINPKMPPEAYKGKKGIKYYRDKNEWVAHMNKYGIIHYDNLLDPEREAKKIPKYKTIAYRYDVMHNFCGLSDDEWGMKFLALDFLICFLLGLCPVHDRYNKWLAVSVGLLTTCLLLFSVWKTIWLADIQFGPLGVFLSFFIPIPLISLMFNRVGAWLKVIGNQKLPEEK